LHFIFTIEAYLNFMKPNVYVYGFVRKQQVRWNCLKLFSSDENHVGVKFWCANI